MAPPLRIATRGSNLARFQAQWVADRLDRQAELVVVSTTGDRRTDVPIWEMGGRGVFVKEVQEAVLDGRADLAVHSAKDLPAETPAELTIAAFPGRADPRDCIIGCRLDDLPTGAVVATGSVRRRAQLAWLRPDLTFSSLRGNIETRLRRARDVDAAVMAFAALERLGMAGEATEVLEAGVMLPQVAQGTLAVECRTDDEAALDALAAIDDAATRRAAVAERGFLGALGGGCNLPVGALAADEPGSGGRRLSIEVMIASLDGRVVLRHRQGGAEPHTLGRAAAETLLYERGGASLLEAA